jgi:hypothetical protein
VRAAAVSTPGSIALAAGIALGAARSTTACATHSAAPESETTPCAALHAECARCTLPGPQETCSTAAATGDDVQCTVALDDPQVVAACASEAGAATSDAGPLPACASPDASADAATNAAPDAGCTCSTSGTCSPACAAGGCLVVCPAGATCQASCAGGGCTFDCKAGSTCANSCAGGDCVFQCEPGAVCTDSCDAGADASCIGH